MSPEQIMLLHLPPPHYDMIPTEDDLAEIDFVCNSADDILNFQTNGNDTIINPEIYILMFFRN